MKKVSTALSVEIMGFPVNDVLTLGHSNGSQRSIISHYPQISQYLLDQPVKKSE
jgi:hypothetical protein